MVYVIIDKHQPLLGMLVQVSEVRLETSDPEKDKTFVITPGNIPGPDYAKLQKRFPLAQVVHHKGYLKLNAGDYVYYLDSGETFIVDSLR